MSGRGGMERAFLEAIRESPDDDAPRLIYADWLDDHGDPARAAFIRVQCELDRLPEPQRRAELEGQERSLLRANRSAWLGPLDAELQYTQCTFRRGFPEELTARPTTLVKLAGEFDARVPDGRVTLYGGFGDPAMKALADCPSLGWMVGLKYEHPRVTESGLEFIGNSPNLPRLRELSIQFANFTLKGLLALTASPHRSALRRLSIHRLVWQGETSADTAAAFAAPEVQIRLHALSLQGHEMGPSGAAALAGTENLAEVKELDLLLNDLGDDGAVALAHSRHLRGLSSLSLQTNNLTDRSVRELVDSPLLDGIRTLNLGVNPVGDQGAAALAAAARLSQLRQLSLFSAGISDRGAEALAASPHLGNLTGLQLSGNSLSDRGSQVLFDSPHLQNLERISLGGRVTGENILSQRQRKQWQARLGKGAQV